MSDKFLKKEDVAKLVAAVIAKNGRFVAPTIDARQVVFKPVKTAEEITFDYILARNSYKEFVFPQTEPIAKFTVNKHGVDFNGVEIEPRETIIFGARPCEAASLASLRAVFTWDFVDEFYTRREEKTIVMSIGCVRGDDACFCTTVELSPESTTGSDVYLLETKDGFKVSAISDRGKAFVEAHSAVFSETNSGDTLPLFIPEKIKGIDKDRIKSFLANKEHYDDKIWGELARKCMGCGACTFVCPTCHCFDITDEGTAFAGERRKNWDACQFDHFTLHASGHNPRHVQYQRWRNRFMCKFNFYPNKFKSTGCVGCGRCIRVCPVRLDITEVMEELSR